MRLSAVLVSVALVCSAAGVPAQEEDRAPAPLKIYKWTDADGIVHYAAQPPEAATAEEVKVRPGPPPAPPEDAEAVQRQQLCDMARKNLELLEMKGRSLVIQEGDTVRPITERERNEQLEAAKLTISDCEKAAAEAADEIEENGGQ